MELCGLEPEIILARCLLIGHTPIQLSVPSGTSYAFQHCERYVVDTWLGATPEMAAYRFLVRHHPELLRTHAAAKPT
jgi:hypothetical protein